MRIIQSRLFLYSVAGLASGLLAYGVLRRWPNRAGARSFADESTSPLERKFGGEEPGETKRDVVEEASIESFPASDAPAW